MNPLNILMAQSDRFFKNNQKDPAPPAALLSFPSISRIQIVPDLGHFVHETGFVKSGVPSTLFPLYFQ